MRILLKELKKKDGKKLNNAKKWKLCGWNMLDI